MSIKEAFRLESRQQHCSIKASYQLRNDAVRPMRSNHGHYLIRRDIGGNCVSFAVADIADWQSLIITGFVKEVDQ